MFKYKRLGNYIQLLVTNSPKIVLNKIKFCFSLHKKKFSLTIAWSSRTQATSFFLLSSPQCLLSFLSIIRGPIKLLGVQLSGPGKKDKWIHISFFVPLYMPFWKFHLTTSLYHIGWNLSPWQQLAARKTRTLKLRIKPGFSYLGRGVFVFRNTLHHKTVGDISSRLLSLSC